MVNLFSPELKRNPYPMYQAMRQSQPVMHMESLDIWSVFRYADVKTVLSDHTRFSSQYGRAPDMDDSASFQARRGSTLITTDPPRHTDLRSLVNRAFTPRAVEALEPRIAEIANELFDKVGNSGEIDLVKDFSYPLPVIVIAELLGIPSQDRDRFKHWSDEIVASADQVLGKTDVQSDTAHREMGAYFYEILQARRAHPQNDLISALIQAEVDNERLSEEDILSFCWLLLVAGNETTTNLIGNAMLTLLEHPDQLALLRENSHLLSGAIEESLRYRSPVQAMFRMTTGDVEIAGQTIPAGKRVVAWIGSANRDEERFVEAEKFDITRNPNPHIAFGHGIHFCLGAPLARLEARVALAAALERLQDVSRVDDSPLEPARGIIVHGVTSLPLRFSAK
ncbi:cytochrome P450 [Alicyclobacillus curvatus]|nr:cytochrome P450 [Alicyclobacillus curvatus]